MILLPFSLTTLMFLSLTKMATCQFLFSSTHQLLLTTVNLDLCVRRILWIKTVLICISVLNIIVMGAGPASFKENSRAS